VAGLRPFFRSYLLPSSDTTVSRSTGKYLQILITDPNPSAKRGAALAFSALPVELLAPMWKDVVDALCAATFPEVSYSSSWTHISLCAHESEDIDLLTSLCDAISYWWINS